MNRLVFVFIFIIILVITSALILGLFNLGEIPPLPLPVDTDEKCKFLATDIINEKVYDNYGNKITNVNTKVKCKECKDYLYKSYDGCSRYSKESRLMDEDNFLSLCTSIAFPKACELEFKPVEIVDPETGEKKTLDFREKIAQDKAEKFSDNVAEYTENFKNPLQN